MLYCDAKKQNLEKTCSRNQIGEYGKAGSFAAGGSECAGGQTRAESEHHQNQHCRLPIADCPDMFFVFGRSLHTNGEYRDGNAI